MGDLCSSEAVVSLLEVWRKVWMWFGGRDGSTYELWMLWWVTQLGGSSICWAMHF